MKYQKLWKTFEKRRQKNNEKLKSDWQVLKTGNKIWKKRKQDVERENLFEIKGNKWKTDDVETLNSKKKLVVERRKLIGNEDVNKNEKKIKRK